MQWCKRGAYGIKRNQQVIDVQLLADFFLVIRLGLEPKTPTLKVLCSTN